MRVLALGLFLCSFLSEALAATQFPYEAVVRSEDVEVRSGPGLNYYATGKLKANDHVTVHRHDPGGWYMIAPPAGSFSYLDARFVQRQAGSDRGVVQITPNEDGTIPRALVRIGSQIGDDHTFYGRQLNPGDTIQILGERTLATDRGAATMLMIVPPPREYRWVKGDFVIGADPSVREQKAADPYADPLVQAGVRAPEKPADESAPETGPVLASAAASTPAEPLEAPSRQVRSGEESSAGPDTARQSRAAMKDVDRRYIEMVALPPVEWDIVSIEKAYQDVRKTAPPEVAESIDSRIQALAERRKIQEDFQEFESLTTATSQRDAELAIKQANPEVMVGGESTNAGPLTIDGSEVQTEFDGGAAGLPPGFPAGLPVITDSPTVPNLSIPASTVRTQPPVVTTQPQVIPVTPRGPSAANPAVMNPAVMNPAGMNHPPEPTPVTPQLNGAGIVQRAPARPGTPRYMLIAPNGKFLTYLDAAPGINLEGAVGQSMGLVGRRYFEPNVRAELIVVRQMMPVQLQ
jgi:uncharacterized protein YraI